MLALIGLVGGAGWGAWLAKKRGGNRYDMAQYAAGFGIMWCVIGLVASIYLARG
ncbi:MAG: hypothetical protein HRT60_05300 [Dinoroseobacter sp.]|nr:hypothetical protein [Dinoroseobacter sp.]